LSIISTLYTCPHQASADTALPLEITHLTQITPKPSTMATIPSIFGLRVEIACNGENCAEFEGHDDDSVVSLESRDDKAVARYIKVKEDSNFEVRIHVGKGYGYHDYDINAAVFVGGVKVRNAIYRKNGSFSRFSETALSITRTDTKLIDGQFLAKELKFHSNVAGKLNRFLILILTQG
jgi:hypothetical protein